MEGRLPGAIDCGAGFRAIVVWAGFLLASALYMADSVELFSFSVAPIYLLASNSGPGSPTEIAVHAASATHDASPANEGQSAPLFGMDTEPVTEGSLLDKWHRIESGIAQDLEIIAQCRASKPCPSPAQKLIDLSREGASRSGRARVGVINRAVDLAISPMSDEAQWGVSDHWSDPLETLHSNSGDCEDYAIVKYTALLTAGLPKDAVKIVVLRNLFPLEDHAVVAVRVDDQWLILDNRTLSLVRDKDVTRAIPRFVLDYHGVRRFVGKSGNLKAADVGDERFSSARAAAL